MTATVSADNHCSAYSDKKFIAGAGGRSHYACSGWHWMDDTKYAYLFMEYKENKLDFVFRHSKTRAEISPHFLIDSNENQVLPTNATGNLKHVLIHTLNGTVEFKGKKWNHIYQYQQYLESFLARTSKVPHFDIQSGRNLRSDSVIIGIMGQLAWIC